ncbi:MAG: hypothetical protein ACLTKE_09715 [Coprococcus sp.]
MIKKRIRVLSKQGDRSTPILFALIGSFKCGNGIFCTEKEEN